MTMKAAFRPVQREAQWEWCRDIGRGLGPDPERVYILRNMIFYLKGSCSRLYSREVSGLTQEGERIAEILEGVNRSLDGRWDVVTEVGTKLRVGYLGDGVVCRREKRILINVCGICMILWALISYWNLFLSTQEFYSPKGIQSSFHNRECFLFLASDSLKENPSYWHLCLLQMASSVLFHDWVVFHCVYAPVFFTISLSLDLWVVVLF